MTRAAGIIGALIVISTGHVSVPLAARDQAQFRSSVDVVQLTVAVINGKKVVADLTAADFDVLDNGVRQQVLSVSRELLPMDVTVVVDTSESLTTSLQASIVNAANKIQAQLKPGDRVSLISFNQRIQERLTMRAASEVQAIELGRVAGQTSLNDVIGVVLAARPVVDRRQMAIVFTDGYDSTSLLTEADVIALAGRSNMSMFLVSKDGGSSGLSFSPALATIKPTGPRPPIAFFEQVAAATGGMAQIVPSYTMTQSETRTVFQINNNLLDEPFLKALEDFRSSYVVRYDLTGVPRPGWHSVTVKVNKPGNKYTVRTRTGYIGS